MPGTKGTGVIVMERGGDVFVLALLVAVEDCEKAVIDCIVTLVTGPWDDVGIAASFFTGADFFGFELES